MLGQLEVSNLIVRYGPVEAVRDLSFSADAGQIVALIGANGAGKSTTLKAIMGLCERLQGSVRVDGEDVRSRPGAALAHGVALSPEGRRMFARMTVQDNLLMGAYSGQGQRPQKEVLEQVYQYFPRLKERRKQMAGSLSGGEQQMAAIGRALMAQPRILMLDEPSLGIAPIIVADIARIIHEINKDTGVTVILVEQNAQMALQLASRGYVLESGQIELSGTGEELLANPDVRKAYLGT
ncbi:ABC transporter ATP-binding protein [Fodinicurvata fenggangensis]|uniref:ABC transporter ATP-binding protein n=1 Tax=Fodinicurvata fenggangensis TaxID=1121830 RepID=UPI00047B44B8|nr:ABC transporter ATP-binding protein [Fodinicurvata fenggangensis]